MNRTFNYAVINNLKMHGTDAMINEITTDIALATASDAQLPTVKAVKTYIEDITAASTYTTMSVDGTIADVSAAQTFGFTIPAGALLLGVSLNNEAAITDDDGNGTYTAAFSGGNASTINGGTAIAAAKNTKVTSFMNANTASIITTAPTDITLTPNGTNFTSGSVRAVVIYAVINELEDAE